MTQITDEEIRKDIAGFQERIKRAREKLHGLPDGFMPNHEYKATEAKRRSFEREIEHVNRLISMAREALEERTHEHSVS